VVKTQNPNYKQRDLPLLVYRLKFIKQEVGPMANHKSALKRIRQNEKRRIYNRVWRSRARGLVKDARISIESTSDLDKARADTKAAVRELDKAVSRGVLHKRNAARRKSRLMKQLAAMEAAQ
jgi:small subunit ribosomal protein S20